jgi:acyl carrier protein
VRLNDATTPRRSGDPLADAVLDELRAMLLEVLAEFGLTEADAAAITMRTTFYGDLEMESIDLVALAARLAERYRGLVNFAEFIARFDLDDIIDLRVGQLVEHVIGALRQPAADAGR